MSKYTKLTKKDCDKIIAIYLTINNWLNNDYHANLTLSDEHFGIAILDKEHNVVKSWWVNASCDIEKISIEVLQFLAEKS